MAFYSINSIYMYSKSRKLVLKRLNCQFKLVSCECYKTYQIFIFRLYYLATNATTTTTSTTTTTTITTTKTSNC